MRTDSAEPVRLKDYRPPDYLIDKVDLDVKLDATSTKVLARLEIRPNPQGRPDAALVLDGDGLRALRIALDGESLNPASNSVSPDHHISEQLVVINFNTDDFSLINNQISDGLPCD